MARACIFSVDDNFVLPFKVLFYSLVQTDSIPEASPIYILHSATLSEGSIRDLGEFAERHQKSLEFLDVSARLPSHLPISSGDSLTEATFYRLFTPTLLPDSVESAVYLDGDMLAIRSCRELFEMPITAMVAAVDHCHPRLSFRLWGPLGGSYFQAGTLLIPLREWRNQDFESLFKNIMQTQRHRIRLWDQCVLNIAFENSWQRLSMAYNIHPWFIQNMPLDLIESHASLVHFAGPVKPWKSLVQSPFRSAWEDAYLGAFGKPFDRTALLPPMSLRIKEGIKSRLRGLIHGRG